MSWCITLALLSTTSKKNKAQVMVMTYENPIQSLWIMRRRQHTRILHVALQVPKLSQPNTTDINNIRRGHDRRLGIRSRQLRAERHDETEQILVERKETQETRGNSRGLVRLRRGRVRHLGGIRGHGLAVEVSDGKDVDGDSATITTTSPLGILNPISHVIS